MSLRRFTLCGAVSIVLLLITAAPSYALNPIPGGEVVTTYLAGYELLDIHRTHRGVDIAGTPGQAVVAPVDGTVSFSGTIPATETDSGTTMTGVSLRLQDGRTVTLMPFEDVSVQEGQEVAEGEVLGTLAASGDASSPIPHLHLGVKDGRAYEDPSWLLGTPVAYSAQDESQPEANPLVTPDIDTAEGMGAAATVSPAIAASEAASSVEAKPAFGDSVQAEGVSITGTVTSGSAAHSYEDTTASAEEASPDGVAARMGAFAKTQLCRMKAFLDDMGKGALAGGLTFAAVAVAGVAFTLLVRRRRSADASEDTTGQERLRVLWARFLHPSRGRSLQH